MNGVLKRIIHKGVDVISAVLHPVYKIFGKKRIRILLYHSVCDVPGGLNFSFSIVPMASFGRQMELLSKSGFNVITLDEYITCKDEKKKPPPRSIIITFDDGFADNYTNAFPVLQKHNFHATFFLVTDYVDSARVFPWPKFDGKPLSQYTGETTWLPLSKQNVLEMSARGACFGSHTRTHCPLPELDESQVIEEIKGSKERLEEILSKPVRCISYPFNRTNQAIKGRVKDAGYGAAVCGEGSNTFSGDSFELRRIEILPQDSMAVFKRKVAGAYDWYYSLFSVLISVRQLMVKPKAGSG